MDDANTIDRDGTFDYTLKPVIKELLRTGVCPQTVKLLVDRIFIVTLTELISRRNEAFRLYLSDGQKTIQAVLKREIHPYVTLGDIREGSYVALTRFELASSKKLRGNGSVAYLLIADLHVVGDDRRTLECSGFRYLEPLNRTSNGIRSAAGVRHFGNDLTESVPGTFADFKNSFYSDKGMALAEGGENVESAEPVGENASRKRRCTEAASPLREISSNSSSQANKCPKVNEAKSNIARPQKCSLSTTRPLQLTPLSRLSGSRVSRNKVCDVLVVICSVDPRIIKRRGMLDKRDLRLMDRSTDKKVLLSVFVDPANFTPAIGTIALLRRVTTHEWNGGSLNAYPKECEGREWFIPNPVGIESCDVAGLRDWWEKRQAEEVEKINGDTVDEK